MAHEVLVVSGYCNWKNATAKGKGLNAHNISQLHVKAALLWAEYHKSFKQGSIPEKIGSLSEKQRLESRHCIQSVAEVILLCVIQGIALRGHREKSNDTVVNAETS